MTITAAMVKELRIKSGAGMMDCKNALKENDGNIEVAMDWLRAKGISKADKKAGRTAAEGLVGVATGDNCAVVVEINSETDFVGRNEEFQNLVRGIAQTALGAENSLEGVNAAIYAPTGKSVADSITDAIATIGENMNLRRVVKMENANGTVASYVHAAVSENLGKLAVLVSIETEGDKEKAAAFARQVAMHVAATNPLALSESEIDSAVADRERSIFIEQARESGKPENIIEKMVEGRMRKFFEEVVLLKQSFVINPDLTVEKALAEAEKEIGAPAKIVGFVRYAVGEGIEREETDFAAEVASVAKS